MIFMQWKSIRLELAPTTGFPNGSPIRSYLLRLPLDDRGAIERDLLAEHPARATARRFWPNEADLFGRIIETAESFAICFDAPASADPHPLGSEPILDGGTVSVADPSGATLQFRVAGIAVLPRAETARA